MVRVRIEGHVQGVGFRAWTRSQALDLGLDGWVRNDLDGAVTALISGEAEKVSLMLDRLRQGPPGAVVGKLTAEDAAQDIPAGFRIRH
jgi:acylphosphatase